MIENMAGVSKRRNGVSFTSGEASMRMRVYSQSVRCLTRVSGEVLRWLCSCCDLQANLQAKDHGQRLVVA